MLEALYFAISYLIGAIPFGVLLTKGLGLDITRVGSGNIGATNVWRIAGWRVGLPVLILDIAKGAVPAWTVSQITGSAIMGSIAGLCAVLGHSLSPFLGFKGGKGIATGFGALLGSAPPVAGGVVAVFVGTMALTMIVSVSSLVAATSLPIFGWLFRMPLGLCIAYLLFAAFLFYRHIPNIKRLVVGTEPKFQIKKPKNDPNESDGSSSK